jgi:hypothetical protein
MINLSYPTSIIPELKFSALKNLLHLVFKSTESKGSLNGGFSPEICLYKMIQNHMKTSSQPSWDLNQYICLSYQPKSNPIKNMQENIWKCKYISHQTFYIRLLNDRGECFGLPVTSSLQLERYSPFNNQTCGASVGLQSHPPDWQFFYNCAYFMKLKETDSAGEWFGQHSG